MSSLILLSISANCRSIGSITVQQVSSTECSTKRSSFLVPLSWLALSTRPIDCSSSGRISSISSSTRHVISIFLLLLPFSSIASLSSHYHNGELIRAVRASALAVEQSKSSSSLGMAASVCVCVCVHWTEEEKSILQTVLWTSVLAVLVVVSVPKKQIQCIFLCQLLVSKS